VPGAATIAWRVVGPGEARWQAAPDAATIVVRSGGTIEMPVIPL
jgi:hypothetical protein